jgi:hypothetical protein
VTVVDPPSAPRQAGGTIPGVTTETVMPTPVEAPSRPVTDDGDHDRFAHYAKKADIARAYVTGEAIVALCGKKWVPTRDPKRYPICPTCAERKAAGWRP